MNTITGRTVRRCRYLYSRNNLVPVDMRNPEIEKRTADKTEISTEKEEKPMRRKDREVTEMEEIQQIFDDCKVCRIGIMDEDGPYIVPVNYGYVREEGKVILYIHGAREGKKIDLIRKNANVGIEIDYKHELVEGDTACQYSYYYASIIGKGTASIIDNPREKLKALNVIMKHQTGRTFEEFQKNPNLEKAVAIIRIDLNEYSCKKHV